MPDPTPLVVQFLDEAAQPVEVDKLVLEIAGTTIEKKSAPYTFSLDSEGEGTLRFEKAGLFPYRFPVEVRRTGSDFTLSFAKNALDPPRMAQLAKLTASVGAASRSQNLLTFTLRKPREVVILTGYDYSGGAIYRIFGITRMRDLAKEGLVDDNTVITFFECETGHRTQWVLGRSKVKISRHALKTGWCRMSDQLVGTAAPDLKADHPGSGAMSITDVYEYLEDVGVERKNTLMEFSIFSHSWAGGPILFNTRESGDFQIGGSREDERDPADHDARWWKDFNSLNMPNIDDFKAAFAPDPFVRVWGCLAIRVYRRMLNKARRARRDTQKLWIDRENRVGIVTGKEYDDTPQGIVQFLKEDAYKGNFMYKLSQVIGAPVWGGPPGTGSDYLRNGRHYWMYVPEYLLEMRRGRRRKVKKYFYNELNYMKSRLGWTFSSDWYLKYV